MLGVVLSGASVLLLVHAIVRANDEGWGSLQIVSELVGGSILMAVFLLWQSRATSPIVPLRLFRDRSFS